MWLSTKGPKPLRSKYSKGLRTRSWASLGHGVKSAHFYKYDPNFGFLAAFDSVVTGCFYDGRTLEYSTHPTVLRLGLGLRLGLWLGIRVRLGLWLGIRD